MNYSKYVYPTLRDGQPVLFHSLFNTVLPASAVEDELRSHLFLQGQEREALHRRVYSKEKQLKFFYVPTWECSLRCPMCFVLKELKKQDRAETHADKLDDFLCRYLDYYPDTKKLVVDYLGGEPMMGIDNCVVVNEVVRDFTTRKGLELMQGVTTNGTVTMSDKHVEFLKCMTLIAVSIDGDAVSHNGQRKVFRKDLLEGQTPYVRALRTVKRIVDVGLRDRLTINSALPDEIFNSPKRMMDYIVVLATLGVKTEHIHVATIVPTECKPNMTAEYESYLDSGFVFPRPCCVFQYMSFFALHGNALYGNYFGTAGSKLGNLADPIPEIEVRFRDYIEANMPILRDETCLDCPVVGFCWGGCNHSKVLKDKPSLSCNRPLLELKVKRSAEEGTIFDFGEREKHGSGSKTLKEINEQIP